jgi:ribosomal 50S subunit-recycling heat shock protein
MRLDKYLKVSRVIKRRTLAKDIIDIGLIKVNQKVAKPSTSIKVNDIIELSLGERILTVRVTSLLPYAKKDDASSMFEIISENVIKNPL